MELHDFGFINYLKGKEAAEASATTNLRFLLNVLLIDATINMSIVCTNEVQLFWFGYFVRFSFFTSIFKFILDNELF